MLHRRQSVAEAALPPHASLNVSLTPELAAYIQGRVSSGRYRSASEVVRAALRLLQREEPAQEPDAEGERRPPAPANASDG